MAAIGSKDCVAKGPVTHCLDQLSKQDNSSAKLKKLRDAIAGLEGEDFEGLEEVIAKDLFEPCDMPADKINTAKNYLKKYWFDEGTRLWPNVTPDTFAAGMLEALDRSIEHSQDGKAFPMDCWWVTGRKDFKLATLKSDQQVTLLFMTPAPAADKLRPGGIWSESSDAWVTSREGGKVQTDQVQKID